MRQFAESGESVQLGVAGSRSRNIVENGNGSIDVHGATWVFFTNSMNSYVAVNWSES